MREAPVNGGLRKSVSDSIGHSWTMVCRTPCPTNARRSINMPTLRLHTEPLRAPGPFVSTLELRKAGFNAAVDTRDALRSALESLNRSETPPVGKKLRARRPL
jgi:hypothetical protein